MGGVAANPPPRSPCTPGNGSGNGAHNSVVGPPVCASPSSHTHHSRVIPRGTRGKRRAELDPVSLLHPRRGGKAAPPVAKPSRWDGPTWIGGLPLRPGLDDSGGGWRTGRGGVRATRQKLFSAPAARDTVGHALRRDSTPDIHNRLGLSGGCPRRSA